MSYGLRLLVFTIGSSGVEIRGGGGGALGGLKSADLP